MTHTKALWLFLLLAACAAGGCSRSAANLDGRDRENPIVRRAAARAREGDIEGARALYRKALDQDPRLARAHLDLAILLHDRELDELRAIYHYERYLELRPSSEKEEIIRSRLRLAKHAYAASLRTTSRVGSVPVKDSREAAAEVLDLRRRNETLQARVAELEKQLADASKALADIEAQVRKRTSAQGSASAEARTHRVQAGDTLSSIAVKYYDDAGR